MSENIPKDEEQQERLSRAERRIQRLEKRVELLERGREDDGD